VSRPRRRGGQKKDAAAGGNANGQAKIRRDFWGKELSDEERITKVTMADDPTTVVRSLGPPPLVGRDVIAEHYFAAVYEKASHFAQALAAAGGILVTDDEDDEPVDAVPG
jgi:hypothetical protein